MAQGWRKDIAYKKLGLAWAKFREEQTTHQPEYIEDVQSRVSKARRLSSQKAKEADYERTHNYWAVRDQQKAEQFTHDLDITKMQEKAKIDASLMETRYTAKDKADIARIEGQKKRLWGALQAGRISREDYDRGVAIKENEAMGIIPGQLPSLSPYAKGQNVGEFWDQDGVTVSRKQDGETWQVDERKTARGTAAEQELRATEAKAKNDNALAIKRADLITKLATEKVDDGLGVKRARTPEEIRSTLQNIDSAQQFEARQQTLQGPDWWRQLEKEGIQVAPQDRQFPKEVGMAKAYIRNVLTESGNKIPQHKAEAFQQALQLVEQFIEQQ